MADLEKQLRAPTKTSYFGSGEGISLVQQVTMINMSMLLLTVGMMIFAMLSLCHYILSIGNCSDSLLVVPIDDAMCCVEYVNMVQVLYTDWSLNICVHILMDNTYQAFKSRDQW